MELIRSRIFLAVTWAAVLFQWANEVEASCSGLQRTGTVVGLDQDQVKCGDGNFLSGIGFRMTQTTTGKTEFTYLSTYSFCTQPQCCNKHLEGLYEESSTVRPTDSDRINLNGAVAIGGEALIRYSDKPANFTCKESGHRIATTTAQCKDLTLDGSGWSLNASSSCSPCPPGTFYNLSDNTCQHCPPGSYSAHWGVTVCSACGFGTYAAQPGSDTCSLCPPGSYSDVQRSTQCTPCPRGRVTEGEGAMTCVYCPSGHTTYRHTPNTCQGPLILGFDRQSHHLLLHLKVAHQDLGSRSGEVESLVERWASYGDWRLYRATGRSAGIIRQKYTTSYRYFRTIRKSPVVHSVVPIIRDQFCYTGRGETFSGYNITKSVNGHPCIDRCTNSGTSGFNEPNCQVESGEREVCGIPKCHDEGAPYSDSCSYTPNHFTSNSGSTISEPYQKILFPEEVAKTICDRLGMECTGLVKHGGTWELTNLPRAQLLHLDAPTALIKELECGNPYHEEHFKQTY